MDNQAIIKAKNAAVTAENFLFPRWADNITYLNYGSAGFNIRNNSDASTMFMTNGGNVGIGNTSPTQKLDVTGNVKFSGVLMPNNTAGTSGQVLTSAGAGNVPTWTTLTATATTIYSGNGTISSGRTVGVTDNVNFDSNTFVIDGTNNNVGVGTASPDVNSILHVDSNTKGFCHLG